MHGRCVFQEWKEIDRKLTRSINEARDHYRFLTIVAKEIGPLYRNDPVGSSATLSPHKQRMSSLQREIQESLPGLLNTLVLIHSSSEFYFRPDKIAGLLLTVSLPSHFSNCRSFLAFLQINNQIVRSCKTYLTDDHTMDMRTLKTEALLERIETIVQLYRTSRELFIKMKRRIESRYSTPNHLSERFLLGKFDALQQRLLKVSNFPSS